MRPPRGLSEEEAAAWAALAATVKPIRPVPVTRAKPAGPAPQPPAAIARQPKRVPMPRPAAPPSPPAGRNPPGNLDSHWDRKLKAGEIAPELTLDLHGHGLDRAYTRLMDGMAQARGMGARSVLVVTGKSRPVDPADRGDRRGAIRAKILDWLAASEHGGSIAAVRNAHRRHGGEGALYILLRRGG
tara:strand:- start:440 stop:997 length:558 start_codon:yes stop_codon:yes gene_type:complete